jgi:glycosyltransferase involved in cell wall biosynthesis
MLLRRVRAVKPNFLYERHAMFNFTGVAVSRLTGIPIVLEVNSPFSIEQKRDGEIRALKLAMWMERATCNAATKVIVVSTPLKRILIQLGVRQEKLLLVPNGVNLRHFRATGEGDRLRRSLGLEGSVVIGFIGWFRNWHGLLTLVEVYNQGNLRSLGAKLLLIGDGPAMPELRRFVGAHNLERDVIFMGPLAHEEMHRCAELIDVAVQPAANEYCCPMKILEYMAMAKPIVAPRQENICELLEEGKDALLFDPGDPAGLGEALRRIVQDEELRREMGRNAVRKIENRGYLWTRNAEAVVEIVRSSREQGRSVVAVLI